ncbi:hypothetical protein DERP_007886 [Dermatophagoides pteronyssinus]|uniref:Uncharacterized protein n=1 Tax=Dermatophagoides pteronyssinus TaxID=6956 RepID=A0ABQ8ISW6_DERPT|nr:hypothetical protein DERP_007886 [Dermatophagoides pteronyssinus]
MLRSNQSSCINMTSIVVKIATNESRNSNDLLSSSLPSLINDNNKSEQQHQHHHHQRQQSTNQSSIKRFDYYGNDYYDNDDDDQSIEYLDRNRKNLNWNQNSLFDDDGDNGDDFSEYFDNSNNIPQASENHFKQQSFYHINNR